MKIDVIATKAHYPVLLSSADGIWYPARGPRWNADMQLSDRLNAKYGEGVRTFDAPWTYLPGDPRHFMGRNETTAVAFWKGAVGILTEIELNIAASSTPGEEYVSCGTTYLPDQDFHRMATHWASKLDSVGDLHPKSVLFLAHGQSTTYLGRLCLCAFTPLSGCIDPSGEGPSVLHFQSPYSGHHTISELDQAIFDLVWPISITELDAMAA